MKRKPLPPRFKVGREYIFHYRRPVNNHDLLNLLQERLRSRGVTVHAAEVGLNRYVGGLAFRISFAEGNYKAAIHNRLDGQIVRDDAPGKKWSVDDYVLTFESVGGTHRARAVPGTRGQPECRPGR